MIYLNHNLQPWNTKTTSLLGYPKVIPYTKFEHFWIIRFWVMLRTNKWKMHLLTLWPWPLTFQGQNHTTSRYPKVIPCSKFECCVFELSCTHASRPSTDTQQTESAWVTIPRLKMKSQVRPEAGRCRRYDITAMHDTVKKKRERTCRRVICGAEYKASEYIRKWDDAFNAAVVVNHH